MSWDISAPDVLTERYVTALEGVPFTAPDGSIAYVDAHTPNGIEAAMARTHGQVTYELYLYQAYLARELMPDTAIDWLPRHAAIWGVPRNGAQVAVGNAIVAGAPGTQLPQGTEVQQGTVRAASTSAVVIPASGTLVMPLQAEVAGVASNLPGGTVMTLVSTIPGVAQQQVTLDADGLAGGVDLEEIEDWRTRILEEINSPAGAGRASDYVKWAKTSGAAYVQVYPGWLGAKTVGVVIAMPGPAVPTPAQIARVQAYMAVVKPVTTEVIVVAASLLPIDFGLALNPDTVDARAAAQALLASAFAAFATIGTPWYQDATWAALAGVLGIVSRRIVSPPGDVPVLTAQLPVLGAVSFEDPY